MLHWTKPRETYIYSRESTCLLASQSPSHLDRAEECFLASSGPLGQCPALLLLAALRVEPGRATKVQRRSG